jgi:hypothetical protein
MTRIIQTFKIGEDFTEEQITKWKEQLVWWITQTMPNVKSPREKADKMLLAGLNGTRTDGKPWINVSNDFYKRMRQISGFDLKLGVGVRGSIKADTKYTKGRSVKKDIPQLTDHATFLRYTEAYKKDLIVKYPHLENEVYAPKVDELAETVMKSRMISDEFVTASGSALERLSKIRESLHKQMKELMEFLEISPKMLIHKQNESNTGDVGSLIVAMERYGEIWEQYERLDALRELLQLYHQLNSERPDGTPQLNAWELWHLTRSKPFQFTCRCGKKYTLLDGFTPEEIEEALKQAYEVYGFGLESIGHSDSVGLQDVLETDEPLEITDKPDIDETDPEQEEA